ncbi:C39 family peptidase [Niallia sp. 01092]|uniref:C39 family peptidase n=1 Tax=unclassified Niallia TaxID=2837522 RepID=UPI003FD27AF9
MNSNAIILYSMIGLLVLLFLYIQKKLTILLKGIIFSLILLVTAASIYVLKFKDKNEIAFAKEITIQATKENEKKESTASVKPSVHLNAPVIRQLPELPRGCEVTSLAMLLQYAGIDVDKMTLAEEITKDSTPYKQINGKIYYGHPNNGFVGNMYSIKEPGFGVYHKPIAKLANNYLPNLIVDLTGSDFDKLKTHLSDNRPVWVITNTKYKKLSDNQFQTWITPNSTIKITKSEHSVLLTGYDDDYIYFNDPLTGKKNKKAPIKDFQESWVQMGSQAITYINS